MNFFKNIANLFSKKSNFDKEEIKKYDSTSEYTNMALSQYFSSEYDDDIFDPININNIYNKNPIVFRCVNLICSSVSSISLKVFEHDLKSNEHHSLNHNHQIVKFLENPNFSLHCSEFIEKIVYNLLIYGNVFLLRINYKNVPREIHILENSDVSILTDQKTGIIYGFKLNGISNGNSQKEYLINPISGDCDIFHLKNSFSSSGNYYGASSLEPIFQHIKYHNDMISWNSSMIKNGAKPSGAFFLKSDKNGNYSYLSEKQKLEIREQINKYSSPKNAGRPMIIQGPLEWKEFSIRPKDMDFFNADKLLIRHISNALGVPIQLLGDSDSTYNNFLEAKKMLYELTVLPILKKIICNVFNNWICKSFNSKFSRFFVDFNEDDIPVLAYRKAEKLKALKESDFLTINEKRKEMGFDPIEGCDKI
jgi:HK97 family phage portal protein